ncbi:MAG: chromosome condensation protein CrcB [Actinomycetota bacterium]|nr:chromosome condensation protein CrcB [Actinomycetota bacterium]
MTGRHRASRSQPVAVVVGGAAGALLRYATATTWPLPHQLLVSTTATAGVAFLVGGYLLATGATSMLRAGLLGLCGSAASLSAYAALTVSQPPGLSVAFLILPPAVAIGGLLCGLLAARVAAR